MTDEMDMYIDEALEALGGEDAPDFLIQASVTGSADLVCPDHGPLYTLGSCELWELVADARQHYEEHHNPAVTMRQRQDQLDTERMDGEHG
jgi:hypothetical protein